MLVMGLATIEWNSPGDKCDPLIFERNRAHQDVNDNTDGNDPAQVIAHMYFSKEHDNKEKAVDACMASQYFPFHQLKVFTDPKLSDYVPFLIVAVPLYLNMVAPGVGTFISRRWPSRMKQEDPDKNESGAPMPSLRVEDGRMPRPQWFLKTMMGLLLITIVISLLLPYAEAAPEYCTHLRDMESDNRIVLRQRPLELGRQERMTLIKDGEWRYGCIPRENMATLLVGGLLIMTALLSSVAPAKKRYVPTHTNATGVIINLFYFIGVSGLLVWSYSITNRLKILNMF
jgi:hypothetical protein